MEPVHVYDNVDDNIEEYSGYSSCSSDSNGISGEPQIVPRVGEEYQAKIPDLIPKCERSKLIKRPTDSEPMANQQECLLLGLPIPVMWANVESTRGVLESEGGDGNQAISSNEFLKGPEYGGLKTESKVEAPPKRDTAEVVLALPHQSASKLNKPRLEASLYPFPGSPSESWKDVERDSFLLGLFIFGKNLALVKRFVGSKNMGDILSFYYGKFYKSVEYRRWSGGRSQRSRRVIHGQKIFMGWRQQELLSRISSRVSEETKKSLLEVSKAFGEGRLSLEDYIFTLRGMVGVEILIQSVHIGQGKKDLTSTTMEPARTTHSVSANPEIPTGKACSSLTPADIVKFLTGGFRLSKARSSDLFWEAVWPRLLARGWHSEQPKDHVVSRYPLVFLVPGVKKFSRRRLVKGNHYFDSITDVLNKVACEPKLLELENEAKGGENREEHGADPSLTDNPDSSSDDKRHRYLQPRVSYNDRNFPKFTIVDTSMACNGEGGQVRDLRFLPAETVSVSTISASYTSESDQNTTEDLGSKEEKATTLNGAGPMADGRVKGEASNRIVNNLGNLRNNFSRRANMPLENCGSQSTASTSEKQQKKPKVRHGCKKYISIGSKRQRPRIDANGESSCCDENDSQRRKPNMAESQCQLNSTDGCDPTASQMAMPGKLSPASSLAEDTRLHIDVCSEKPLGHADFDLNVPQTLPEFEIDEIAVTEPVRNDESSGADHSSVQAEASTQSLSQEVSNGEASTDQNFSRRQSTRSRPLTKKALEALAYGYLGSPKKKRKDSDAKPKSSRQVRPRTVVTADFRNGTNADASKAKKSEEGFQRDKLQ